jgi:hypothetical protein
MSSTPLTPGSVARVGTTRTVDVSSMYACCSSLYVGPVTRMFQWLRSSDEPVKSSKKRTRSRGAGAT